MPNHGMALQNKHNLPHLLLHQGLKGGCCAEKNCTGAVIHAAELHSSQKSKLTRELND